MGQVKDTPHGMRPFIYVELALVPIHLQAYVCGWGIQQWFPALLLCPFKKELYSSFHDPYALLRYSSERLGGPPPVIVAY